jgi:hypothetical protein
MLTHVLAIVVIAPLFGSVAAGDSQAENQLLQAQCPTLELAGNTQDGPKGFSCSDTSVVDLRDKQRPLVVKSLK